MSLGRFIYTIFTFIVLFFLLTISVIYPESYMYIIFIMIFIIMPNSIMKRKDNKKKMEILFRYSNTGNTEQYINEMNQYNKNRLFAKENLYFDQISIGLALVSAGEFSKAEELMVELSKKQDKVSDAAMIFYLRFCADYFFYTNKVDELKTVVDKLEYIIRNASPKTQNQLSIVFVLSEAKKDILEEKNLESIKTMYTNMHIAPTPLNQLSRNYILSMIDIKLKDYDSAIKKLKDLSEKKYNLFFVNNAKKLLQEIKQY